MSGDSAADALRSSEARFRTLAASTPTAIFECDLDGQVHYANERWFDLVGTDLTGGHNLVDRIHDDDLETLAQRWTEDVTGASPQGFDARCRIAQAKGRWLWIDVRLRPVLDDNGCHSAYLGAMHDVTDLVIARQNAQRFQAILEATSDLVAIVDDDMEVQYLNPAAREAVAMPEGSTAHSLELSSHLMGDEFQRVMAEARSAFEKNQVWSGETAFRRANGVETTLSHVIVRGADDDGTAWFASLARDVAENRVQVQSTSDTDRHDGLTGLLNRSGIFAEVRRSLERVARSPLTVGLLCIDIDQFQLVNDSYGHDAGDELLINIAQRLRACSGPNTVLGRFGSDEFIVLVEGMTSPAAMQARAQYVLKSLSGEVQLAAGAAHLTVSIGVITDDGTSDAGDVLRDADATASLAKRRGRGRIEVFDYRMHDQVVTRLATEIELRHGLDRDQFVLHYQPVVDVTGSHVLACEALVRWQHPRHGLLAPDAFLPVVEESGLSAQLGAWVLQEACTIAAAWPTTDHGRVVVAVNISADQISSPDFASEVRRVLRSTGLPGAGLCLEVTEGIVMADPASTAATLTELRSLGVTIAIDDFGTGYSSLSHLTRLPVDTLKVDKTFVHGLGMNAHDDAITATVVSLGHSLGLHVVAEGVETAQQLQAVRKLGCDAVQGFFYSQPVVAEELVRRFADQRWMIDAS